MFILVLNKNNLNDKKLIWTYKVMFWKYSNFTLEVESDALLW